METFKRYLKKRRDTLETIAAHLKMEPEELRQFHNFHCELDDLIGGNKLPKRLKEILYPSEEDLKQQRKDHELQSKRVKLALDFLFEQRYTSQILNYETEIRTSTKKDETILRKEYSINYFFKTKEHFYVEINMVSPVSSNSSEISGIQELLNEKVSEVLYPLMLVISPTGNLTDIHNYSRIKGRWDQKRSEIEENFQEEWVSAYLEQNQKIFYNKEILLSQLKKDWFLCCFFNGLYTRYNEDNEIERTILAPIINSIENIPYLIKQKIHTTTDEHNQILIEMDGTVKLQEGDLPMEGIYHARYFLNDQFRIPENFSVECSLETEQPKKVSVTVSKIEKNNLDNSIFLAL